MARIRSIKPEITESETLAELPLAVCWTFACLWPHCDDRGRRKAQPKLVKADLYPMRDDMDAEDIAEHLTLLVEVGVVCLYTGCDGKPYLHVVNWDEHQKVDKPSKSRIPPCREHEPDAECVKGHDTCASGGFTLTLPPDLSVTPRETPASPLDTPADGSRTLDLGPRTVDLGTGTTDLAPAKPSRDRDEVWDAMLAACHVDPTSITATARGAYNTAAKALRDVGATPGEIHRRAAIFRGQWREVSLTPTALARRWGECDRPFVAPAPQTQTARQLEGARQRAKAAEAQQQRKALP